MRRFWWLVLGGLMLVAGVIVAGASHSRGQSSFGWIAYSPLSEPEPSLDDQLARDARDTWAGIALAGATLSKASRIEHEFARPPPRLS